METGLDPNVAWGPYLQLREAAYRGGQLVNFLRPEAPKRSWVDTAGWEVAMKFQWWIVSSNNNGNQM